MSFWFVQLKCISVQISPIASSATTPPAAIYATSINALSLRSFYGIVLKIKISFFFVQLKCISVQISPNASSATTPPAAIYATSINA
ncbi:hypothetical protein CEXT_315781 [Caerostris extrusa]|uniref:Uncharacterized protein n=1 Tax=Caerostris extrusa TaxID=172846 RepID=A0AAV4NPC6_CAEEX|nr:hypothetical protein CEXT_315781 [Caerostris extrusa]